MTLENNLVTYIILFILNKITFKFAITYLNYYIHKDKSSTTAGNTLIIFLFALFLLISIMFLFWFVTLMLKGQVIIF